MKYFLLFLISFNYYSCFQIENQPSNYHFNTHQQCRTESFSLLNDSIVLNFCLDTIYKKIAPTIVSYGSEKSFSYSDKKDSIFILIYWNTLLPSFIDNKKAKEYFVGMRVVSDEINILNRGEKQYIKYDEVLSSNHYLTCEIADSTMHISFKILYQTIKVDSTDIHTFNKMCDSFSFEIYKQ